MRLGFWPTVGVCAVFWLGGGPASRAQSLIAEDLRIPMAVAGPRGLEAFVVAPGSPGRHPLVLISHGSPREAGDRPGMSARLMLPQLNAFARLGFVAAGVLRRGYGSSPGGWAEGFGPCGNAEYVTAGRAGSADLKAAIVALSRRPDVDPGRILAVGHSAGGFATVALTEDPPPGLVAAISFAGGRGSSGPDKVCSADALVDAFHTFGARSRIPMLWVYAENDHFFGPELAGRLLSAFRRGGGNATFVAAPAFGADGHALFSEGGRAIWAPIVDAFLKARSLPSAEMVAARASVALEPPRQLGADGRKDFQTYRDAASHKAFAVGATGAYAWRTARGTTTEAVETALRQCGSSGGSPCHLYAVDDGYAPE